jgi:hypothetical protein
MISTNLMYSQMSRCSDLAIFVLTDDRQTDEQKKKIAVPLALVISMQDLRNTSSKADESRTEFTRGHFQTILGKINAIMKLGGRGGGSGHFTNFSMNFEPSLALSWIALSSSPGKTLP